MYKSRCNGEANCKDGTDEIGCSNLCEQSVSYSFNCIDCKYDNSFSI